VSKHIWLTAPTKAKSVRLVRAYRYALSRGAAGWLARAFAGYYVERETQGMRYVDPPGEGPRQQTMKDLYDGAVRSDFRFARRPEYTRAWFRHNALWLQDVDLGLPGGQAVRRLAGLCYDGADCSPQLYDALLEMDTPSAEAAAFYYKP
jgi:hypothetical protein